MLAVSGIAAIGGLLFGYDTGVISGAILFIRSELALSDLAEGLAVGAVTLGALFGALAAGSLADRFGRRHTNISAGMIFILGALGCSVAQSVGVLVGCRFVLGLAIGLVAVAAPMYIAEAAPPAVRGRLVSFYQLAITVGIFVSYVVDRAFAPAHAWRWMLGLAAVPGVLLVAGMLVLPDSPRWLVLVGREQEGRRVLARLREPAAVEGELSGIRAELAKPRGSWADLFGPGLRPALVVGVGLAVFQQVTGINTIIYYAPTIFQRAGFSEASVAIAATMGIGAINVLATFVAIALVDRMGRRPLLLAGLVGMTVSLAIVGFSFRAKGLGPGSALGGVTLICLGVYIVFFAFSLGPVVWLMISEIFPNAVRAEAVAVSTAANWGANFLVSLTFPLLLGRLGATRTFLLFAACGAIAFAFVLFQVPETKGRSLEQISQLWD